MDIRNDHVLIKKENVLERFGDDLLLFESSTGKLFEVNETGKAIWKLLDGKNNASNIKEKLSAEFDKVKSIERDVHDFLNRLLELDLIEIKLS
jgi:uncharacterized protein YifE (UPF0438 family)